MSEDIGTSSEPDGEFIVLGWWHDKVHAVTVFISH